MLYIKGFDKNLCCRGFQFEVGKEYKIDNDARAVLCSDSIFHFCVSLQKVNPFYSCRREAENRFCYIECLSEEITDGDKVGSKHIRIVKEIVGDELNLLLGFVNGNVGLFNVGNKNTGDRNAGNGNAGDRNAGDWNTGDRNAGHLNAGDRNAGDRNAGHLNAGDRNAGDRNAGDWNTGDRNAGVFNSCDFSTGFFCNNEDTIRFFNIDSGMTMEEAVNSRFYKAIISSNFALTKWNGELNKTVPVDFKEACTKWWGGMEEGNKEIVKSMPNFDSSVFGDITGISV